MPCLDSYTEEYIYIFFVPQLDFCLEDSPLDFLLEVFPRMLLVYKLGLRIIFVDVTVFCRD